MMGELDGLLKQIPIQEESQELNQDIKQVKPRQQSSIKMHM
ncbi:hypothetical protein [Lactococcus lactis]|nr:hypothetical protein [Lactococcus lactis]